MANAKAKAAEVQEEADLVNTSFETKATILSDTNDKEFGDIEKGGIEMKFDEQNEVQEEKKDGKKKSGLKLFKRDRQEI